MAEHTEFALHLVLLRGVQASLNEASERRGLTHTPSSTNLVASFA